MTSKGSGMLSRDEDEMEILESMFKRHWPQTEGRRVSKTRYKVILDGACIELDVYHGALEGLIILENEFLSEAESADFVLPEWASSAVEVTANAAFKNKNLATRGMPILPPK